MFDNLRRKLPPILADNLSFLIAMCVMGAIGGVIWANLSNRAPAPVNSGFTPGFATHLTCRSISTDRVVIDRDEPFGTLFKNHTGYVLIQDLTADRKRRWTLFMPDLICEEDEL